MFNCNALLLKDFYKAVHSEMLDPGMTKSVSYFTPRSSRINRWNGVVNFGLQAFCKTWLIDYFNENFFNKTEEEVVAEYSRVMDNTLGKGISLVVSQFVGSSSNQPTSFYQLLYFF